MINLLFQILNLFLYYLKNNQNLIKTRCTIVVNIRNCINDKIKTISYRNFIHI